MDISFQYELATKPFFGPLDRAFEALSQNSYMVQLTRCEYIDYLITKFPDLITYIEHIRFFDFICDQSNNKDASWRKKKLYDNFHFRLAVTNTAPELKVREELFERRFQITTDTGWYPLIMGSRVEYDNCQINEFRTSTKRILRTTKTNLGKIKFIKDVTFNQPYESNSTGLFLECEKGGILFDTGFEVRNEYISQINCICISHFHQDHCKGLWKILEVRDIPILLSKISLEYLLGRGDIHIALRRKLYRNAHVVGAPYQVAPVGGELNSFPVFHAPGSLGFSYNDGEGTSVIYLGDFCFQNGFLNQHNDLLSKIKQLKNEKTWVLLDSAMINKKDYEIADDTNIPEIFDEIISGSKRRNIVILANNTETLVYSYLKAFILTTSTKSLGRSIKLVLNNDLYKMMGVIWQAIKQKSARHTDPFISSVIGKASINFAESVRVYPISSNINPNEPVIFFITPDDLHNSNIVNRLRDSHVLLVGTLALMDRATEFFKSLRIRKIERVFSSDWTFHSTEADLASLVEILTEDKINVGLFHNYSRNMKRFIRRRQFDAELVGALSEDSYIKV